MVVVPWPNLYPSLFSLYHTLLLAGFPLNLIPNSISILLGHYGFNLTQDWNFIHHPAKAVVIIMLYGEYLLCTKHFTYIILFHPQSNLILTLISKLSDGPYLSDIIDEIFMDEMIGCVQFASKLSGGVWGVGEYIDETR